FSRRRGEGKQRVARRSAVPTRTLRTPSHVRPSPCPTGARSEPRADARAALGRCDATPTRLRTSQRPRPVCGAGVHSDLPVDSRPRLGLYVLRCCAISPAPITATATLPVSGGRAAAEVARATV